MCCDWAFLVVGRILPDRNCDLECARGCGVGVVPSGIFGASAVLVSWLGCRFERGCCFALRKRDEGVAFSSHQGLRALREYFAAMHGRGLLRSWAPVERALIGCVWWGLCGCLVRVLRRRDGTGRRLGVLLGRVDGAADI